jgi:hypothetical protein
MANPTSCNSSHRSRSPAYTTASPTRDEAVPTALRDLGTAIRATCAAIALIVAAVAITWFAPTSKTPPGQLCIHTNGHLVVRLSADTISVRGSARGTTIKPCE